MMPGALVFALAAALFFAGLARDGVDQWIAATALPNLSVQTSVEVLDRHGDLLRVYPVANGLWRLGLRLEEVDPAFVTALLHEEDKRFYQHGGIDPRAFARALAQAIWHGHIVSGGSTLTMQVARLLENSGTGRWLGKLRQIRLALALERRLSKPQILTLYLKLAPYGGNLEGLRAATLAYFGKEPLRLTAAQIALLIAIPQSPEARRPDRATAAATAARDRVLARARRDGRMEDDHLRAARSEVVPTARRNFPALAPHLADRVVAKAPGETRHPLTLDKTLQVKLEQLAREVVASQGTRLQMAMVVADHSSGEILASVGSAAFQDDQRAGYVDMTRAIRSPGSTLKPLIYGMAFDEGLAHPETLIEDQPRDFNGYRPQNFDRHYRGTIRIREALQQSLNIPVVALTEAMGPAKLLARLDQAEVPYALPRGRAGLAIALGGMGLRLEDLVQLYAMIARGGVSLPLTHKAQAQNRPGQRVLSEAAAWQIGDILAGLAPPPGAPANRLAYKTGTSYGHRDAWAIGYDGRHVIGVWMGRPDGTPVPGAFGADMAAPLLFQAFARLKPALTPQPPAPAATLLVSTLELPQPLRHFRHRRAAFQAPADAPAVTFPPDGAEVELLPEGVLARVSGGKPPFTWLANGAPVVVAEMARAVILAHLGRGFVTLSVIDAEGRSARSKVRLR